jgi:hypothetical protein
MPVLYVPHHKKIVPNIDGARIVGGKSHSSLWLVLAEWLTQTWLVYMQKSTIYMTYITIYPPSGAHAFNAAWTALHTLQERIQVLRKWPQDVPSSLLALGTQSWLVARRTRNPYRTIGTVLKQASPWGDGSGILITRREETYLLTFSSVHCYRKINCRK